MRVGVVGHLEWVTFGLVDRVPRAGEIVNASETWDEPAGGGAVAAVQLAKLAGACDMFTAVGDDDLGELSERGLTALGLTVHAAIRDDKTRRAVALIDHGNERTIMTLGERLEPRGSDPLPWDLLDGADVAYVTAGDPEALRRGAQSPADGRDEPRARGARRVGRDPRRAGGQRARPGGGVRPRRDRQPRRRCSCAPRDWPAARGSATARAGAGRARRSRRTTTPTRRRTPTAPVTASRRRSPTRLAAGMEIAAAVKLAARAGAACATGRGPYSTAADEADIDR